MLILIAAAAVAAAHPAPAAADAHGQMPMMPMTQAAEHKDMDRCSCCKDMAGKHDGPAGHAEHKDR